MAFIRSYTVTVVTQGGNKIVSVDMDAHNKKQAKRVGIDLKRLMLDHYKSMGFKLHPLRVVVSEYISKVTYNR